MLKLRKFNFPTFCAGKVRYSRITCPDGTITFPNGRKEYLNDGWIWKWSKKKIEWARENDFLEFRKSTGKESGWSVCYKNYLKVDNEDNYIERAAPHKNLINDILNANAATNMKALFNTNNLFDYSKPIDLIKRLISFVNTKDSIILDFFSGSGTTAHAVMQLNAEDKGNRKFICVQLPEVTDESSEAYKAGYKNICEIGKERIRRAGAKIASEQKADLFDQEGKKLDTGFKVFKLDTSNLKTWDATPIDSNDPAQIDLFMERLNGMIDTIKHDRTDVDMVYEVMLKMGIPLTYSVTPIEIGGKTAYSVGDDCLLLVCLQEGLTTEIIETMASDYLPSKLVLSEKCFADDTAMANAHYILKEREIELKLV